MLNSIAFQPPCNSFSTFTAFPSKFPLFFSLSFPNTVHRVTNLSLPLCSRVSFFNSLCNGRSGLSISASAKRKDNTNFTDLDDEDDVTDLDDEDGDEEEEGEEKMMPFDEMQRWFQNKPSGFGEGKTYDTSLEDKLLEETERSRKAQLANINKLKNSPTAALKKKMELQTQKTQKAADSVPSGIQVRVGNLPKKRNIHRDLQSAFKEFPGIVNISPAVSGSKKTRDPICKGFAFLYLESEKAADRFVEMYSKQNIQFGKIQKQITCEIINSQQTSESTTEQSAVSTYVAVTQLRIPDMGEATDADSDIESLSWDSQEKAFSDGYEIGTDGNIEISTNLIYSTDDEPRLTDMEVIEVGIEDINLSEPIMEKVGPMNEDTIASSDSVSPKQHLKDRIVRKKKTIKEKSNKKLGLNLPGSAKRLKVRERAVLTGVFSKYGGKANSGES